VRLVFNAISFNDGEVVLIDGDPERRPASSVDEPETVTFASYDVDDVEGDLGTTDESTGSVDNTGIGDGDNSIVEEFGLEGRGWDMVVVRKLNDSCFIVHIVHIRQRVVGIVDDERAAQPVTVLCREMAVIPKGSCLVGEVEVIQESLIGRDRALCNHGRAIISCGSCLEETVPVDGGTPTHCRVGQGAGDIDLNVVACRKFEQWCWEGAISNNSHSRETIGVCGRVDDGQLIEHIGTEGRADGAEAQGELLEELRR